MNLFGYTNTAFSWNYPSAQNYLMDHYLAKALFAEEISS